MILAGMALEHICRDRLLHRVSQAPRATLGAFWANIQCLEHPQRHDNRPLRNFHNPSNFPQWPNDSHSPTTPQRQTQAQPDFCYKGGPKSDRLHGPIRISVRICSFLRFSGKLNNKAAYVFLPDSVLPHDAVCSSQENAKSQRSAKMCGQLQIRLHSPLELQQREVPCEYNPGKCHTFTCLALVVEL